MPRQAEDIIAARRADMVALARGMLYEPHWAWRAAAELRGLITEPRQAEDIIAAGRADMVALARGMLYEPHWAWRAAAELRSEVSAPKQYWRAPPRGAEAIFRGAKVGQR